LMMTRPVSLSIPGSTSSAEMTVDDMLLANDLECCGPKPLEEDRENHVSHPLASET
jgi:hypothetical protein